MVLWFTWLEKAAWNTHIEKYECLTRPIIAIVTYTPPVPFSTVSTLTPLLMYPPEKVLDALNIRREPTRVIVNGAEYSIDYLNS